MPQQVTHLFEGGVRGEIMNVVAAVREDAAVAIDEADPGRGRDHVLEASLGNLRVGRGAHDAAIISDGRRLDRPAARAAEERCAKRYLSISAKPGALHRRIVSSAETVASVRPSGAKASELTMVPCALSVATSRRARMFQNLTTPSALPTARVWPSGENAIECTAPASPRNTTGSDRDWCSTAGPSCLRCRWPEGVHPVRMRQPRFCPSGRPAHRTVPRGCIPEMDTPALIADRERTAVR